MWLTTEAHLQFTIQQNDECTFSELARARRDATVLPRPRPSQHEPAACGGGRRGGGNGGGYQGGPNQGGGMQNRQ